MVDVLIDPICGLVNGCAMLDMEKLDEDVDDETDVLNCTGVVGDVAAVLTNGFDISGTNPGTSDANMCCTSAVAAWPNI